MIICETPDGCTCGAPASTPELREAVDTWEGRVIPPGTSTPDHERGSARAERMGP